MSRYYFKFTFDSWCHHGYCPSKTSPHFHPLTWHMRRQEVCRHDHHYQHPSVHKQLTWENILYCTRKLVDSIISAGRSPVSCGTLGLIPQTSSVHLSGGTCWKDRIPSFSSDLLNESTSFNKDPNFNKICSGVYKFERHCSVTVVLDPDYKLK